MNDLKVYVLGAGCSAGCGYPVANQFVSALEHYSAELAADSAKIKACVDSTVKLLRGESVQTVDDLVARIAAEADDHSRPLTTAERSERQNQIHSAKIATEALFITLEKMAKPRLSKYHSLLTTLLGPPTNWLQELKKTRCRVLSFNYDRLFEFAFREGCRYDSHLGPLYGKNALNSGFDSPSGMGIDVDPNRFAFLKLHGSVAMRCQNTGIGMRYSPGLPGEAKPINDSTDFWQSNDPSSRQPIPLTVFPHEKERIMKAPNSEINPFPGYQDYISAIWKTAESIIAEAAEIRFIGYSFAAMDQSSVFRILSKATNCKKLFIRNLPGEAERICEELNRDRNRELPCVAEPLARAF